MFTCNTIRVFVPQEFATTKGPFASPYEGVSQPLCLPYVERKEKHTKRDHVASEVNVNEQNMVPAAIVPLWAGCNS